MGTHYKGNKKEINSLNSFIKLKRAAEAVSSRVNASLAKKGLTESQFSIIESLYHLGPLSQKELGNKLFKSGGNITLVVDNLEKLELVKRERGKPDRRYFQIHLTEKGTNLVKEILPGQVNLIVEEMNILSDKEQILFQDFCKRIGKKNIEM